MIKSVKSVLVKTTLRTRILFSFLGIIFLLGILKAALGIFLIQRYVVGNAQEQTQSYIRAALKEYDKEIRAIEEGFNLVKYVDDIGGLKRKLKLDYLYVVDTLSRDSVRSEIVAEAFKGNGMGGTRLIDSAELASMSSELLRRAVIAIEKTPHARPQKDTVLTRAMALEFALPFFNAQGEVVRVMYGGKIINRRFELVDMIHSMVFEEGMYKGKPIGTVTIFQGDVRIATNVLNRQGTRAVGTMVSGEVYRRVIEQGLPWLDRAFVVTDWYLTAYEPLTDIRGNRIGMLYVGSLEEPFTDMKRRITFVFLLIIGLGVIIAAIVSIVLSETIVRPVQRLLHATQEIADGDLDHRIKTRMPVRELDGLASSFNGMAEKIKVRDANLNAANEKLTVLNKNYLDMVGMVSHELKGVLSSAVLNVYSVKNGFLGVVTETQHKALDSIARNLDYLTLTVRRFLDLSRIETGDLAVHPRLIDLRSDVVNLSLEAYGRQIAEKGMTIENNVPQGTVLTADPDLLLIALNNLVGNAVSYGAEKGVIRVSCEQDTDAVAVEVYNDGTPIPAEQHERLFKKFSRLQTDGSRKVRGTGLGLFVTREIIKKHGGTIKLEARERGNAFIFTIIRGTTNAGAA
jgi:two-component system NtrC family sensor kinase